MHSVEGNGSPRKRTISRGMSEEESLRCIIKETEASSRRLTRSDSRGGTLKKRSDSQQSDQDTYMGVPDMPELQNSYDEVVQELRGLEVERDLMQFQVDVLQDTLGGVEELLAEAQREAREANAELEREKEARKKLESLVCSLMQEVERLKEEVDNHPNAAMTSPKDEDIRRGQLMTRGATQRVQAYAREVGCVPSDEAQDEGSPLKKLHRMVTGVVGHLPSLTVEDPASEDGVLRRPHDSHDGLDPSPDKDTDSVSAYEDAVADTPDMDRFFPGGSDTPELPDDSATSHEDGDFADDRRRSGSDDRNPDHSCVIS